MKMIKLSRAQVEMLHRMVKFDLERGLDAVYLEFNEAILVDEPDLSEKVSILRINK
jgi:hypothetical protein